MWLTHERRSVILLRFCERFGIEIDSDTSFMKTDEGHLLDAIAAMEVERNQILDARRGYDRKRIRQKMRGRRHLSKAQNAQLYEIMHPSQIK